MVKDLNYYKDIQYCLHWHLYHLLLDKVGPAGQQWGLCVDIFQFGVFHDEPSHLMVGREEPWKEELYFLSRKFTSSKQTNLVLGPIIEAAINPKLNPHNWGSDVCQCLRKGGKRGPRSSLREEHQHRGERSPNLGPIVFSSSHNKCLQVESWIWTDCSRWGLRAPLHAKNLYLVSYPCIGKGSTSVAISTLWQRDKLLNKSLQVIPAQSIVSVQCSDRNM